MSIYANGLNIQMNEIAILTFMEQMQSGNVPVCQVAIQYEVLKMMHETIGQVIQQREMGLNLVQRDKNKQN